MGRKTKTKTKNRGTGNRYKLGITERRMNNRAFRKIEEKIVKACFEEEENSAVANLARKVGVARSTVYVHHRVIRNIATDYRRFIFRIYNRFIKEVLKKKKGNVRELYGQMILFVVRYKALFEIATRDNKREIFIVMIEKVKPEMVKLARIPQNYEKLYKMYLNEVVTLLEEWCKKSFPEDEIENIVRDAMYLTDTARGRLMALENN